MMYFSSHEQQKKFVRNLINMTKSLKIVWHRCYEANGINKNKQLSELLDQSRHAMKETETFFTTYNDSTIVFFSSLIPESELPNDQDTYIFIYVQVNPESGFQHLIGGEEQEQLRVLLVAIETQLNNARQDSDILKFIGDILAEG